MDTELSRLHERIDDLGRQLSTDVRTICVEIASMKAVCAEARKATGDSCSECQLRLSNCETILHGPPGNGNHPGLVTTVAHHTSQLKDYKRESGKMKWAIIGGGIALAFSLAQFWIISAWAGG